MKSSLKESYLKDLYGTVINHPLIGCMIESSLFFRLRTTMIQWFYAYLCRYIFKRAAILNTAEAPRGAICFRVGHHINNFLSKKQGL